MKVVTSAAELTVSELLPIEVRYALATKPERFESFRRLLDSGYGIGVRIVDKTPERVLLAVDRISRLAQGNTILPWLERLLREEELPLFTREELEKAEGDGVNLYEEARAILAERYEFRKFVLVDLHNRCIGPAEQELIQQVNSDMYPLAIDAIVHRVTFDNAHTRTETAQSIIKALVIIGPIAHVLEHWLVGLGKVFAASADDLLAECAEMFALRGSGFTWRQLIKRSRILIPVFILAVYGSFQVEPLIQSGRIALAGVVFGLSAVALSLTTAIQSIDMYRKSFEKLAVDGKIQLKPGQTILGLALRQDFTNPARLGLFLGAMTAPLAAAIVFSFMPSLSYNGWVLALIGSTESLVAGLTVIGATRIERWRFHSKVEKAIQGLTQK